MHAASAYFARVMFLVQRAKSQESGRLLRFCFCVKKEDAGPRSCMFLLVPPLGFTLDGGWHALEMCVHCDPFCCCCTMINCERSELQIWQVHEFGLGCSKLSTPRGYKEVPKSYSDWSVCTVFDTPEPKLMSLLLYKDFLPGE